ncbi:hypothetical protein NQ315_007905 [Exocentrus adspersus]|uniref:Protein arginine N-methyltransferase domain-containing protein n=1 Tax=Exocentrus adspersus TaxID=1586481 RepID=A0AAV8W874_9CUCU|nr:hypothetical protein NQ315_007905 [Exocentrus adspersus]
MASRVPKLCSKQKKLNGLIYLKRAKQACSENNYTEAYEYFVNYFESLSDPTVSSTAVQTAFTKLVCKIGVVLEETNNIEELLKCYLQALNLFPNNYIILNNLGAYMFKVGEVDIARRYLEVAVKVNKDYLPAEKNLMHVKWHQIPRWHFRMLNDKRRNMAYNEAITEVIKKGYTDVVDVGAGCGLLSLMACRNGVTSITAIEENKTLYKLCLEIFKENNFTNINVLNCLSTSLSGIQTNIQSKCNVIITEIFDVAFFGERALESIFHALAVICTEEEDFKIIPCGAKLYVTGIHCDELASKYWYIPSKVLNILNLQNICIKQRNSDPYEAEHLSEKDVDYITDTQQFFNIDFYNLEDVCSMCRHEYHQFVKLKCKAGVLHAFAVWFDLNLTENVSITTKPFSEEKVNCWEQAVFYLDHPVFVSEGEILTLKATVVDCKLKFSIVNGGTSHPRCFEVSKEIISFMNDKALVESIVNVAHKFNSPNLEVADSNIFPLFGLLLAKNGCNVYHAVKNNEDAEFLEYVLKLNKISLEKFSIRKEKFSITLNKNMPRKQCIYFFEAINIDGSLENISPLDKQSEITLIPKSIGVTVQLIYSHYIDHCNHVNDENVLNFRIAKYMNEYSGNEHPNLENLQYTEFSDPVVFMLEKDRESSCDVVVKNDGLINALYFWYDMQLSDDIIFSTLNSTHFKKSCFFLHQPKSVKRGESIRIIIKVDGSYLKISI